MPSNNVILTPKVFARLVLFDLGGALNVARNMTRTIKNEFGKKNYKVGDTVQVRKPYRFQGGEGLDWDPEPLVDQETPITVNKVPHVHFQWDDVEKTLDIREAMELYTRPVAISMASKINAGAATYAADNALSSVGTPGTAPTSESTYLTAGDILCELGLPEGEELNLIVNRRMSSAFVSGTKTLFNPTGVISKQWNQGYMVDSLGYRVYRDQTINTHTVGTYAGTPLVNGANQTAEGGNNSQMTLITDGWSSGASTLNQGEAFVIGSATVAAGVGVMSVQPNTRVSTGRQQTFRVVTTISDTTGAMSPVIQPAITISGQYQNVDSAPVDNAIITVIGATGAIAQQGLLMHRNAFAFVSVPLSAPLPNGVQAVESETDDETGLSIRYVRYWDGDKSVNKNRFDSLIGYGSLYEEMACVIQA